MMSGLFFDVRMLGEFIGFGILAIIFLVLYGCLGREIGEDIIF